MRANLISVVDDDESIRRTTKLLIESFGYRATVFESADTLLRLGQLNKTSCLIVDIQMPGMNGLQLQSHLVIEGWSIPIIFITAYGNKQVRRKAMQAGAVAFLEKPLETSNCSKLFGQHCRKTTETRRHVTRFRSPRRSSYGRSKQNSSK